MWMDSAMLTVERREKISCTLYHLQAVNSTEDYLPQSNHFPT
jgi:hypothetical protein